MLIVPVNQCLPLQNKANFGEAKLQFFNGERLDHAMGTGPASEFRHPIFTVKNIGLETRKCCR